MIRSLLVLACLPFTLSSYILRKTIRLFCARSWVPFDPPSKCDVAFLALRVHLPSRRAPIPQNCTPDIAHMTTKYHDRDNWALDEHAYSYSQHFPSLHPPRYNQQHFLPRWALMFLHVAVSDRPSDATKKQRTRLNIMLLSANLRRLDQAFHNKTASPA